MNQKNIYSLTTGPKHSTLRGRVWAALVAGMLAVSAPFASHAAPVTVTGANPASTTVCMNGSGDASSVLTVNDPDVGDPLTWTVSSMPVNGMLAVGTYTATSTGSDVTPAGFTYTPATGYSGPDMFTVDVTDGVTTTTITVNVMVNPLPDVFATADQTPVCNGTMTADVTFSGSMPGTTFEWTNDNPAIGILASGSGDILAFMANNATSADQVATIVVTPWLNGCAGATDDYTYTVKPTPTLSSVVNNGYICDNATFSYTATSATAATTFAWTRDAITGITAPAASGGTTVSEMLHNTTINPISVAYVYTLTANGCVGTQNVTTTVNPTPTLFPTPLTPSMCNGETFSFTQNSMTPGVVFSWSRAAQTGISTPASSGTGDISEALDNTTVDPVTVTYTDTLNINGCLTTEMLSVVVNPSPVLTSTLTPTSVCNGATFSYVPTSATTGVTFEWSRDAVTGITEPAATGTYSVSETLSNTTDNPIAVTYTYTLTANGCSNTQDVVVLVNPTATLSSTLTPAAVCDSSFFDYTPTSTTSGATFAWTRAVVAGIATPAAGGSDNISERLWHSASVYTVTPVTYVYTVTINGCSNTQEVVVSVNPKPTLSNTAPAPICDNTLFTFTPASLVVGATYAWHRDYVPGIGAAATDGVDGISEALDNTTNANISVVYNYSVTANGCTHVQNVTVQVHPTPILSSTLNDSACSGVPFVYNAQTSVLPAVTFAWMRDTVAGITPVASSGTGGVNETLVNSTTGALSVIYTYTLSIGSCTNIQNVNVLVRPAAAAPSITTVPSANLCSGTLYQNFGAGNPPATGETYTWSVTNGSVYATAGNDQYALISFPDAGTSVVTLTSTIGATGCIGTATYTVTVGAASSAANAVVIRNNGKLICLQADVKTYQWGYDDHNTLDSVLLGGETGQSYFLPNTDFSARHYWVITTTGSDACYKKTYYNKPTETGPKDGDNVVDNAQPTIVAFPNPATSSVNIQVNAVITGNVQVKLTNMMGQVLHETTSSLSRVSLDLSALPAGIYMADCYMDGARIGTARIVKN